MHRLKNQGRNFVFVDLEEFREMEQRRKKVFINF